MIRNSLTRYFRRILNLYIARIKYPTSKIYSTVRIRGTALGHYATIYDHVHLYKCNVGDCTYIQSHSIFLFTNIGRFCSIAHAVKCGLGKHPTTGFVSTHPAFYSTGRQSKIAFTDKPCFEEFVPSRIGNDVLIGTQAIILDGVSIGDGAIIGAGAVVTRDVPPYAVVGGAPAKVIRYRFTHEQISFLLQFKWWDRDMSWIKSCWKDFSDIEHFIGNNSL